MMQKAHGGISHRRHFVDRETVPQGKRLTTGNGQLPRFNDPMGGLSGLGQKTFGYIYQELHRP